MKLGIVVNVMGSDEAGATTYRFAAEATSAGHQVWIMSAGNLCYNSDDTIGALARSAPPGQYSSKKLLEAFSSGSAANEWIRLDELDVLLLRNNPGATKLSTEYSRTAPCNDCDYRVRILKTGGNISVEINGEVVNHTVDPDPHGGGYIGLRNMMGVDRVSYDNFRVWSLR